LTPQNAGDPSRTIIPWISRAVFDTIANLKIFFHFKLNWQIISDAGSQEGTGKFAR
jgi:hypothetical protein